MPDDPNGSKVNHAVDRRSVLKLAGAAAASTSLGLLSTTASARTTVDLGQEGLSEGDVIDPYLDDHFTDGTEVLVPPGTYRWNGGGFPGEVADAALRGDGGVFAIDGGDGWWHGPDVLASGGTVLVENMQVLGTSGGSGSDMSDRGNFAFGASDSSATCVVRNFIMRDGGEPDTWGQGIYIPGEHRGELILDGVDVRNMNNNGSYTSGSASGPVHWRNCYFQNNNISSIRIATDGSTVENCVIVNDGTANDPPVANQRGIWVRETSRNVEIRNMDVYYPHTGEGSSAPIKVQPRDGGGDGHIENARIYTDSDANAIYVQNGADYSGNDIDLTGSGDLTVPSYFTNVCQGDGCETARSDVDGSADSGSTDNSTDSGSTDDDSTDSGSSQPPNTLTIQGNGYTDPVEYEFTVSEALEKGPGADSNDTVDGLTATGAVGGTDDFYFAGEVTAFSMTGTGSVYVNGQQVDPSTLGSGSTDGSNSTDGTDSTDGSDSTDGTTSTDDSTSMSNTIVIDGTRTNTVSEYTFSVSGDVERDSSLSMVEDGGLAWDTLADTTTDSTVVGVVGDGKDAYSFSGELTSLDIRGSARVVIDDGN